MPSRYPHQVLSRLQTAEEKAVAERLAERNGVSVSALIRILLLQAEREGWSLEVQRAKKVRAMDA